MQIPGAALSMLSALPADIPEGLAGGDKWPVLQTIGVFVGIPVGALALIWALVLLKSGASRPTGSGDAPTAVFSGPYAGSLDPQQSGGTSGNTGPVTETGEDSGMHREVTQPDDSADGSQNRSGEAGVEPQESGSGSGGAGARW